MRVVLVDDERLARAELRRLLRRFRDVEIVGEARNVDEAVTCVAQLAPELLFLDIKMPGGSGFEVLERLDRVPAVVFTTAFDEHAVRAFEVNALDYLMKPVEPERLETAVRRAREQLTSRLTSSHESYLVPDDRIFVRDGGRCWLIRLGDVSLFESEANYTRLHIGQESPMVRRSLRQLGRRLDPKSFFRANRRQIVNLEAIESVTLAEPGRLRVQMADGAAIEISRRRVHEFQSRLEL